jgi:DNA-binding LacI/PurR family transcriptional regulator
VATIKDIARAAQLDISTVSRALNDSPRVKESTKRRIRSIARGLGYHANEIARSLVTRRTKVIGLVVSDIGNPFFSEVTKGVESEARRHGYSLILCSSDWNKTREREHVSMLRSRRVDGLIIHPSEELSGDAPRDLAGGELPTVFLANAVEDAGAHYVSVDNVQGAFEATSYLVSLGHRRIAHATGDLRRTQKRYRILTDRFKGYRAALAHAEIPFHDDLVVCSLPGIENARRSIRAFLRRQPAVTAFFASSDQIALGAYKAIREAGLRIPEDISVVGFDDIEVASLVSPSLTTFEQPKFQLGQQAVQILVRLMAGQKVARKACILRSQGMIIRESCRECPRGSRRGRR